METTKMILDWMGRHPTLIVAVTGLITSIIVAVASFIASIIVAKITGGIELKKALCLKRVDAYEAARCQLMRMTNIYEIILGQMAAVSQSTDSKPIGDKIALLVSQFLALGKVMEQDDSFARIALYSTELPRQDPRQLQSEEPRFINAIRDIWEKLQSGSSEEEREALEGKLKDAINRFAPLVQNELQHLYDLDEKLKTDIQKDKRIKSLLMS